MTTADRTTPLRSVHLWIDGVGLFALLLPDEVSIGRVSPMTAANEDQPDIALMGNLSRRHLTLRRLDEDYVVTPLGKTMLNGQLITQSTLLGNSSELLLNDAVHLKFEICSPLSASARVTVLSFHRGQRAINGFVLMAETCLLGPGAENHIRCPSWPCQLVLVRRHGGLAVKGPGAMTIDGSPCSGRACLDNGQAIAGDGFRMRIEEMP